MSQSNAALSVVSSQPAKVVTLEVLDAMPSPMSPAAIALKDLSVPQLAEAFHGLDQVQQHHERLSGICAIMKGLVLVEAKAKIGHGGFMSWVKDNFPKSHKTANQYKRLAEEFGKLNPTVQFENLRSDMLTTMESLEGMQLDLRHPVVKQVADWVNGRSAYQLLLELGPSNYNRDEKGKGKTGVTAQTPLQQAEELLLPAAQEFVSRWRDGLWVHLPHGILEQIDGDLLDIRRQIKKALDK